MHHIIQTFLSGFSIFITHFIITIIVLFVALFVYMLITPHNELSLIKQGNKSAALSLGGIFLGLAIPLSVCLKESVNIPDIIIWGSAILFIQIGVYFSVDLIFQNISKTISEDELAPTIFLVSAKISIALLNAAAISG
jgi:putative membrane protein